MITKAHITKRASSEGVPATTVERDYVLAHIISALAARGENPSVIFKGGTALRLCHFSEYRYSADLDFSVVNSTVPAAMEIIAKAVSEIGGSIEACRMTEDSPPRIEYRGPLGKVRSLKLDLTDDELVLHVEKRLLLPTWTDLPGGRTLHVYQLVEIAGEKLRCMLQRLQCRDVFDLFHLFNEGGVDPDEAVAVFRLKAKHRQIDPDSFRERFRDRLAQYGKRWDQELAEHVAGSIPHFEVVERDLTRRLRGAGLL